MMWRQVLRRSILVGLPLVAAALLTVALGGHAAAQRTVQTAPVATATAAAPVHNAGGGKGRCTNGLPMGESGCPSTSPGMGLPSTGAGGTAGSNTAPPTLPRTGGAAPVSHDQSLWPGIAAILILAGLVLAGWTRRSAAGR